MSQEKIPLYAQTSYDWYNKFQENNKPLAVSSSVGINEYTFGRTTPDNKFIVASGLVMNKKPFGLEMVGGQKIKKMKLNNGKLKKNLNNSIMKIKSSKKTQKGGNYNMSNFQTPEFGMNSGVGTQMAVNTPAPNVLLKQQKTTNDPLQTQFGVNPGVADNLASNSSNNKILDYSMMNPNDKVKAYNYFSGGNKKNKSKKSKKSKKTKKGGNLLSFFPTTSEFGMNPGVGDQMAADTAVYNPLLKQQKSSGQHLNTIFGDNAGVADQIASNDLPGYSKNSFPDINFNGGGKEKKLKKKVMKKTMVKDTAPKKKVMKKTIKKDTEPKKKVMKKTIKKDTEPKKKVMKKTIKKDTEPKKKIMKKTMVKDTEPKKKVMKKDTEPKKKTIKKDTKPKKKDKTTLKSFFNKLLK
jgi:hypothetical protein